MTNFTKITSAAQYPSHIRKSAAAKMLIGATFAIPGQLDAIKILYALAKSL